MRCQEGSHAPLSFLVNSRSAFYNALISIALSGQPNLGDIAGPIGEALIMTAIGLFVAVPAVMGYNWLLRRNRDIQEKLKDFSADLHTYLLGGARIDSNAPILSLVAARPSVVAK
jgi:biopolymer transport protein ExbB